LFFLLSKEHYVVHTK